jgi:hypothetical protein
LTPNSNRFDYARWPVLTLLSDRFDFARWSQFDFAHWPKNSHLNDRMTNESLDSNYKSST